METVSKPEEEQIIQFPETKNLTMHNDFPIMGHQVTLKRGNRVLIEDVNFQVPLGKRIGITGPNGSGKSTLLDHIVSDGEGITLSKKIKFSIYKQLDYQLQSNQSMLEFLRGDSYMEEGMIRSILNNLGFGQAEVTKSLKDLSGGEATRLVIAKLFTDPSNVLNLDEPTNFIDIQTIEALESLMRSYKGTILFTSHDQYFMENMAEEIWEIKDKKLEAVKY